MAETKPAKRRRCSVGSLFSRKSAHGSRPWMLISVSLLLAGCQAMYLHDPSRAKTAAEARKALATVDTAALTKVEQANLDRLLAEELKSLRARARIDSDLALLEIADNEQNVARHYVRLSAIVEERFGTAKFDVLAQRRFDQIQLEADRVTAAHARSAITRLKIAAPDCSPDMPPFEKLSGAQGVDTKTQLVAQLAYNRYLAACKRMLADSRKPDPAGGMLRAAQEEASKAREALKSDQDKAAKAQKALRSARTEYAKAVKDRQKAGEAGAVARKALEDKAKDVLDKIQALESASPAAANHEKIGALVEVLTAAAGGKVETTNENLAPALIIAKRVPSLVGTIEQIEALRSAPTVSNLVIALNHQVLAAELDARLASMREEEVTLLQEKVRVLEHEASLWRAFNDQLCNLALLGSAANHPSTTCEAITFQPAPDSGTETVTCNIRLLRPNGPEEKSIPKCVLSRSWKALFSDSSLSTASRRALYEAAVAYLNARNAGNRAYEYDFKVVNHRHRTSLELREAALRQWNNIVAVPVEQLDAYYASGIKPAELADLLVKALGLTAIAIGVAQ